MADKVGFSILHAIIFGILGFVLAELLASTLIFSAILNLGSIGLFLGFIAGGFKDKLNL